MISVLRIIFSELGSKLNLWTGVIRVPLVREVKMTSSFWLNGRESLMATIKDKQRWLFENVFD